MEKAVTALATSYLGVPGKGVNFAWLSTNHYINGRLT